MKKIRTVLVCIIVLSFFIALFPTDSFAYVSVRGYYRSDGTYVRSHVRSSPNALKYDNYSWTPSQGLYNKSYFAPTKNYSSDWYAPSYITDPYYYSGKSLYEIGRGGLDQYISPKIETPTIPTYDFPSYKAPTIPTYDFPSYNW